MPSFSIPLTLASVARIQLNASCVLTVSIQPLTGHQIFSLFKSDPTKKLKKQHALKLEQAMQAQRKGDIRTYSQLSLEAENLYKEIEQLEAGQE